MTFSPESLYLQLGQLVADMPDLASGVLSPEKYQWLGRAAALIEATGDRMDAIGLRSAADNLNGYLQEMNAQKIASIVHRGLARAEMAAPTGVKGAFITAGSSFDAFAAIGKVLGKATRDLLIVEPYADAKALTDFAIQANEGIVIRILADTKDHKASLKPAMENWDKQFAATRPLEIRLAPPRTLHDRLIIVDGVEAWSLTQSLNAFAARSPATIVRVDADIAAMKISAYEPMWQAATRL